MGRVLLSCLPRDARCAVVQKPPMNKECECLPGLPTLSSPLGSFPATAFPCNRIYPQVTYSNPELKEKDLRLYPPCYRSESWATRLKVIAITSFQRTDTGDQAVCGESLSDQGPLYYTFTKS